MLERWTARLVVRPLAATDRAEWARMMTASQSLLEPWMPNRPAGLTLDHMFERALVLHDAGACAKMVGVLADGRIAAVLNLNEIIRGPFQNAYAGWSVNAEVAGQGIVTEGMLALLDIAFAPPPHGYGLHRVQANILPRNARSVRVAEKCGLRYEGLARRYLEIAGVWEDHAMYARTVEEGFERG